mmetsp:Transcript_39923/g.105869  ORF Transcript_39923/g.105869 Transcript_39923/m.105869 type:complete len:241 (+) Transcript_39923:933-1655(+)
MPWPMRPSRAPPRRWVTRRRQRPCQSDLSSRAASCSTRGRSSSSRKTGKVSFSQASTRWPGATASQKAARTTTGSTCHTTWSCFRNSTTETCAAPLRRTWSTPTRPRTAWAAMGIPYTRCGSTRPCRRTSACTTTATSQRTRCCGSRRRQAATSWRTSTCGASWTSCTPHRAGVGTRTTVRWARGTCSPPSASTRWRAPRTRWSSGAPPSLAPPCACRETAGALRSWPRTRGGRTSTSSR